MYFILGTQGQLGQLFIEALQKRAIPFFAPAEKEADILNLPLLHSLVRQSGATAVINCAAYTNVEKAEDEEKAAYAVNVQGAKNLGEICADLGITGVHFSTDYVFSGNTCAPYGEEDIAQPLSVYGKTKLQGEQALLESGANCLICRTSWLYSFVGRNFYATMRALGAQKSDLNVVYDQIGTPTYAPHLVEYVLQILPQFGPQHSGVYHLGDEGVASWYDFAWAIMQQEGFSCRVHPIRSEEYPTKAKRPPLSILSKDKVKKTFGIDLHHWMQGVISCQQAFAKIS